MATTQTPQRTDFTLDVMGRFTCNGLDEALASTLDGQSPFHYIILGGGTFGGALASFLMRLDPAAEAFGDDFKRYHSRILVLEGGPFVLPEHEQNLPKIGIGVPGPTRISDIQPNPADRKSPAPPRNQVWGVPWHSDDPFNGLAYCLGGRSLFWGGWAPRFLKSEMPTSGYAANWPKAVVDDLHANGEQLWNEAAHQIGVDDPNDFTNGELHEKLREVFFAAITGKKISSMIAPSELPAYLDHKKLTTGTTALGDALKLDAPYAVQSSTRSGFFPFNKFSSVPMLMAASRDAATDSFQRADPVLNNSRRQLMVVPNCHVLRLETLPVGADRGDIRRVTAIQTSQGRIPVAHNAVVIFASAAIESARLALNSFSGVRGYGEIGKNLMVHLRSNTQIRVKRNLPIFTGLSWAQLEVSGIQLRGRIDHGDGTQGHFHLQVSASGVRAGTGNAESEIFQKIPDLDQFESFKNASDDEVVIAIRGIGEFSPMNPLSRVELDPELDEYGVNRVLVRINDDGDRSQPAIRKLNPKDSRTLQAMVNATNDVLKLFGETSPRPVRSEPAQTQEGIDEFRHIKLDGVGTTYHESGTLRMGDNPDDSVLNADQRFNGVTNAFVTDMSILPTCGSANPVQPGIALTRRLASHLARPRVPRAGMFLFKDTPTPFWRTTGVPANRVQFGLGELEVGSAGGPFGLYWCTIPTPAEFELSLDWLITDSSDNSGVFIGFPDPDRAPPDKSKTFTDPGFVAAEYGFEIQIDNTEGGGNPTRSNGEVTETVEPRFRGTGAIYNEPTQKLSPVSGLSVNQWHSFIIRVRGPKIEVDIRVNGGAAQPRSRFTFKPGGYPPGDLRANPHRGLPSRDSEEPGAKRYIGLQSHFQSRLIKFRNIFIRPI